MAFYEAVFILRQDLSSQDASDVVDGLAQSIKENDGKLLKKEYWGLRSLAYKINKSGKAHYFLLGIEAPAGAVKELDRKCRINENVMRNMTVKVDYISKDPSPIMEKDRDSKDDSRAKAA